MSVWDTIKRLEHEKVIEPTELEVLQRYGIDPLYLFMETPTLFQSIRPEIPSLLVYQGEVYIVKNPERVKEALNLRRCQ